MAVATGDEGEGMGEKTPEVGRRMLETWEKGVGDVVG